MKDKKVTAYPVSVKQLKRLIEKLEAKETTETVITTNTVIKGNLIECKHDLAYGWLIYLNNESFDPIIH